MIPSCPRLHRLCGPASASSTVDAGVRLLTEGLSFIIIEAVPAGSRRALRTWIDFVAPDGRPRSARLWLDDHDRLHRLEISDPEASLHAELSEFGLPVQIAVPGEHQLIDPNELGAGEAERPSTPGPASPEGNT